MLHSIIELKTVFDGDARVATGIAFDTLTPCCKKFEYMFKTPKDIFNIFNPTSQGISIGKKEDYQIYFDSTKIDFCPFCGGHIEIHQSKIVKRTQKTKTIEVFDKYEEKDITLELK